MSHTIERSRLQVIVEALFDTTERTTDLENVYNDTTGDCLGWDEVIEVFNLLETLENEHRGMEKALRKTYSQRWIDMAKAGELE